MVKEGSAKLGRAVVNIALSAVVLAAILFAAGSLRWPNFWIFVGFYLVATAALMIWLKKRDPGLFKERTSARAGGKAWDKVIVRSYTVLLLAMLIVAALDTVRFHWSRIPPALQWLAFAVIVASWIIVLWVFRENSFLAGYVRIQSDRGHTVCSTGPYRFVRHPMYAAVILVLLSLPVYLGSLYALLPGGLAAALFVVRTALEDRTLRNELPGYMEYAAKVRWKLVPRVW
jgi:protein-S-isoprenylcysteine O-methyltransferase Ste14